MSELGPLLSVLLPSILFPRARQRASSAVCKPSSKLRDEAVMSLLPTNITSNVVHGAKGRGACRGIESYDTCASTEKPPIIMHVHSVNDMDVGGDLYLTCIVRTHVELHMCANKNVAPNMCDGDRPVGGSSIARSLLYKPIIRFPLLLLTKGSLKAGTPRL